MPSSLIVCYAHAMRSHTTDGAPVTPPLHAWRLHLDAWRLLATPRLLRYALLPVFCVSLVMALALWGFVQTFDEVRLWADGLMPTFHATPAWWNFFLHGALELWRVVLYAALTLISLCAWCIGAVIVSQILLEPIYEHFSEIAEAVITGRAAPTVRFGVWWRHFARNLWVGFEKMLLWCAVPLVLQLLHFVPIVGSALMFLTSALWLAFACGVTAVDYACARHAWPRRDRVAFALRHAGFLTRLGSVALIPGYLLFGMPALILAGTLVYVRTAPHAASEAKPRGSGMPE